MHAFLLLCLFLMNAPLEGPPELSEGQKLHAKGEVIDVDIGHLVPCVADWNNDGRKDLIVGQFSQGKIRLYLNKGTDAEPLFDDFVYLKAGGREITLEAG